MAISTYQTYLMKGTGSSSSITYAKLVDVRTFPDLGGTPENLDTTTLSDGAKTSINGIQSQEAMEFEANYTKEDYTTLAALKGTDTKFAVWIGANASGQPDGHNGKFEFSGDLSVFVKGGGVNEVTLMTISIAPSSEVKLATA